MAGTRRIILAPLVIGVAGVAVLVALGVWQWQRLQWKEALIAGIEARLADDPVALPAAPDPVHNRLLRVTVTGRLGRAELHAIDSVRELGPGYRVIVPMELGTGAEPADRRILVDLGFVPEHQKAPEARPASVRWQERDFTDEVTGLLDWPDETDSFTPSPDLGRNIWFARDVAAMAAALGTEPVLLVAERHPDGDLPRPRPPGQALPNRHLEYTLTWFGLALVWAIMTAVWLRARTRRGAS